MTDVGIVIALISFVSTVGGLGLTWWRFRRKDRADATAVEEGTISGRFKDADSLMKYIDERVDEKTSSLAGELDTVKGNLETVKRESHEMNDAIRSRETQLWLWDRRGREGLLPMLPEPILKRLGLIHLIATEVSEDTEPI